MKIEFRFYRTKAKEMVYGFKGCSLTYVLDLWENEKHVSEPMQWTGLKDKCGNKIFIGDIVKLPVEINTGLHGEHAYYEILYRNGLWITSYVSSEKGFILPRGYLVGELIDFAENMRKSLVFNEFEATLKDVEIVGNIYENPELLEGAAG